MSPKATPPATDRASGEVKVSLLTRTPALARAKTGTTAKLTMG
jgi:hypothetical protein